MKTYITLIRRFLLTLGTISALAFGANQLFAGGMGEAACEWDPPNALGTCISPWQCEQDCSLYGSYQGWCSGGCCYCFAT